MFNLSSLVKYIGNYTPNTSSCITFKALISHLAPSHYSSYFLSEKIWVFYMYDFQSLIVERIWISVLVY